MLAVEADAEEAAQDIFVKAYRSLHTFEGNAKFSTWLYRISYNHCVSVIRRKTRVIDLVEDVPDSEVNEESAENVFGLSKSDRERFVRNAIEALAETDAVIITLFYFEDLSLDEIAEVTGLTNGNVRIKLHRARKKLYEVLEKQLHSEINSIL